MESENHVTTIQELLKGIDVDFDNTSPKEIKIVRHADARTKQNGKNAKNDRRKLCISGEDFPTNIPSIYALYVYRKELFMQYQSEQMANTFRGIKYIVSFIGEEKSRARFVGVYKILGSRVNEHAEDEVVLDLQHIESFEKYEKRVVIDWVSPANSWHQYYNKVKPVYKIEDMPDMNGIPTFTTYSDVLLSHAELQLVVNNPDWVRMLRSQNCIYAISDNKNGKLYVGSTYNADGILGRWSQYAETGHGNDVDLVEMGASYCKANFSWCILETMPLNVSARVAIEIEKLWKNKLGTIRFGYNNN